jgi:hypothetical protein
MRQVIDVFIRLFEFTFSVTDPLHTLSCIRNPDNSFLFNIIIVCFSEPKNNVTVLRLHDVDKINILKYSFKLLKYVLLCHIKS